ncbi:hypothetical protein ACHQM5_002296 [Ranunculus cassubicifolius]
MPSELLLFFLLWLAVASPVAAVNITEAKPGCPLKCGNVNIPYPFGIGDKCSMSSWANITCNSTFNPPKPFMYGAIEVVQFSLTEVRIKTGFRSYSCYNQSGGLGDFQIYWLTLRGTPYTMSSTKNRIKAIGCDAFAQTYLNSDNFTSGCQSNCNKREDVVLEPCTGRGCCEMPVPKGLQYFKAVVTGNNSKVWSFNPCNAAFIGEEGAYKLTISDFSNSTSLGDIPIVLNFGVGNQTCKAAKQNPTTYVCEENSYCSDSVDGTGYLCSCNKGYEGNPYLKQSCQDVNECGDPNNNPCYGNCNNTPGSYYCSCPPGYDGDGTKDGTQCTKKDKMM